MFSMHVVGSGVRRSIGFLSVLISVMMPVCAYAERFQAPISNAPLSHCEFADRTCAAATYHTGQDYSRIGVSSVLASAQGKVVRAQFLSEFDHGMGTVVVIEHQVGDEKLYSLYAHLASIESGVKVGECVEKGAKIGVHGGSGYGNPNRWGTHLHFEIKTANETGAPYGGLYWGYTPSHPTNYGYKDPYHYINSSSVTLHPDCSSVELRDFWVRPGTITESNGSGVANFDSQFKVKNSGSSTIVVNDMAIDIYKNGSNLFNCWHKNSPQTIGAGSTFQTGRQFCEIYDAGNYSAVARLHVNGSWRTFGSQNFLVSSAATPKPSVPSTPAATDGSSTSNVRVTWSAVSGATRYEAYWCESNVSTPTTSSSCGPIPNPGTTSATDSGGKAGQTYYYRVRACNSSGCSGFSNSNSGWKKPQTPSRPSATDGVYTDKVRVSYTTVPDISLYRVYTCTTSSSTSSCGSFRTSSSPPKDITSGAAGETYYYRVRACSGGNCGDYSLPDAGYRKLAVVKPSVPSTPAATDGSSTSNVRVTWSAVSGATRYEAYWCESNVSTPTTSSSCGPIPNPGTTSATDSGGKAGQTYYYRVRACNSSGCSGFSNSNSGWKKPQTPSRPSATDGVYTDKVRVSYTTVPDISLYRVYTCTTSSSTSSCGSFRTSSSPPKDITSGAAGETYYYRVRACSGGNCGDYSLPDAGYRKLAVVKPSVPSTPAATDGSSTSNVRVTWSAVSGATRYEAYWCESNVSTPTTSSSCGPIPNPGTTSATDSGGNPGQTYYYRVRACNSAGCSDFSGSDQGWKKPLTPSRPSATDGTYTDKVRVNFFSLPAPVRSEVHRCTSANDISTCGRLTGYVLSPFYDNNSQSGVTHYYRIRYCLDHCGEFSAAGSGYQKDDATPTIPEPVSPAVGEELPEGQPIVVSYRAVEGAERYNVQRYDRTIKKWSYSNTGVLPEACSDGLCEVEVPGVPKQDKALWRVRAYGNGKWSGWSELIAFNVIEQSQAPTIPEPVSPSVGDELPEGQPIVVSYRAVEGAERYNVQRYDRTIKKWSYSNTGVLPEACSDGLCEVEVPGVPKQDKALWRVRAYGNGKWSGWSELIAFNVKADQQLASVKLKGDSTCALENGVIRCWGRLKDVEIPAIDGVTDFDVGVGHACATNGSSLVCWGDHNSGSELVVPTLISPRAVSAGVHHNCAIDRSGVVCWGGGIERFEQPNLENPNAISSGHTFNCALDGEIAQCWGSNSGGQLDSPLLDEPNVLVSGYLHSCALDRTGVKCWGENFNGQTEVPALSEPIDVAAGNQHSCAIDSTGVVCWGSNVYGQLDVPPLVNPVSVNAGGDHACAVDDFGIVCWGANNLGQATVP